VQNQPNPDTPVDERRWLDRLRAAWHEVRGNPTSKAKAGALEAVAQERPDEASYRIDTFGADAARRSGSAPGGSGDESVEKSLDQPESLGENATPDSDRFDDEAGR
jgi:hypothetical protein